MVLPQERMERVKTKQDGVRAIINILRETTLEPAETNDYLNSRDSAPLIQKQKAHQVLLRPNLDIRGMMEGIPSLREKLNSFDKEITEQAEIQVKYDVYIEKEKDLVSRMSQLENLEIPEAFDYAKLSSISNEAREKLRKIKPRTLGQASRISGINPSDVQILMVYMGR